ncbi:phosphatase inhibitor-domain-containing protein [Neohortaea acidophila]|uniref:Type 1 phosphatases regulator n=1 Tax=Neohortaea acidophila TaxID=245834 RepID=A0A6A6PIX5_9PEZI|nr:phosphatase inhibitor-domain-containing protein [Neohortaea acidophila]KAF2479969.1 phosphatase inhibitor-domain-containing protein [Neohortaea acidophila]
MSNTNRPALRTRPANSGTATPTTTQTIVQTDAGPSIPIPALRLRAEPEEQRRIQWADDVVDNEGMGKKSSKVCCIYHKPKEPGDSDSSDSDSSSEDDEPDLSRAQKAGGGKGRGRRHDHGRDDGCADGSGKGKQRKASPNAYERQPTTKSKKEG